MTSAIGRAVDELCGRAEEFARLPAGEKAALVRNCAVSLEAAAPGWVADGCRAKNLDRGGAGEEWLSGPLPVMRLIRLLAQNLVAIARDGRPPLGTRARAGPGGRLAIDLLPASALDRVILAGFSGYALMQDGVTEEDARRRQAGFYQLSDPEGRVSLVLGAGNVSSIAPMDALARLFIDGRVCLLKMNPVNEWLGPHVERGLGPLITRGYLRIVYGGADVGSELVADARIADVHLTGSDKTHDLIVWGSPGPDRDRRIAGRDPLLRKRITSELGNVGPVAIVPHHYSEAQLAFQAESLVTMVSNNAGFNCNAAHVVITSARWPQRDRFFALVAQMFSRVPPRKAYYPGAEERHRRLTAGRRVEFFGAPQAGELAWALVRDVDAGKAGDAIFHTEPFCGMVSETVLDSRDPGEFLASATRFMNEGMWGTLNAAIVIPRTLERDPAVGAALDRAIVALRYGTVAINHWPALGYAVGTLPWGGHPASSLENVQSGLGWVHNAFMLDGVDKAVIRGPLRVIPKPVWFSGNPRSARVGPALVRLESNPSWARVPGVVLRSLWPVRRSP